MNEGEAVHVSSRAEIRSWFTEYHDFDEGIWFVFTKGKARTVEYDDVVEEAICFGWVDSKSRSYDDTRTSLYVAPRRPGSKWSDSNVGRVERMTAAGLMQAAGLAAVEAAKAAGNWPVA